MSEQKESPMAAVDRQAASKARKKAVGSYQDQAMFSAMQAHLATAEHTLDQNKGIYGKCKLLFPAITGAMFLAGAIILFFSLTADPTLGQCEDVTDGECRLYQVGDGKCDWGCNVAACTFDAQDCKGYTDKCQNAWLDGQMSLWYASSPIGLTSKCFETNADGTGPGGIGTPTSFPLRDTKCDLHCNFEACGWDGGDCASVALQRSPQCAPGCYSHMLGDAVCQSQCNTAGCLFDLRDCPQNTVWIHSVELNQQNVNPAVVAGVPEYLMCDSTPFPGASGCGFSFDHSALDSAINLRQNAWDSTYFGGGAQGPCTWPTWDPFTSMCVSNDNDACLAQQQERTANEAGWRSSCATMKSRGDDVLVVSILQLHAQHLITSLVSKNTHVHDCRSRCDTAACGYDSGVCLAKRQADNTSDPSGWCAPGCSPAMQNNQVCDAECFCLACGYDAPSCTYCNAFLADGMYKVSTANAVTKSALGGPWVVITVVTCFIVCLLRLWLSIAASLKGYFDPMGKLLAKPCSGGDDVRNQFGTVSLDEKSTLTFFCASLWPQAQCQPLLEPISSDWSDDTSEVNEDTGQFGQIYTCEATKYNSEDGEPLRLELHQALTGAIATVLTLLCLGLCPAVALIGAAKPGLPAASALGRFSLGNLFHPETTCIYSDSSHTVLRNRLSDMETPTCGTVEWPVHVTLLADFVACLCFLLMVGARSRELSQLRKATPRLSDYCVHISGLGQNTYMDSAVQRMVKNISFINTVDKEDMFVYPVWQDDLHWGWAKLQQALAVAGDADKAGALTELVKKLDESRHNLGYPRPFSGHCICIFNKQFMSRACLHHHQKSWLYTIAAMLMPRAFGEEGDPTKANLSRAGDHSDIDWLSLRHGGAVGFADKWRGRAVKLGAILTLAASFVLALALLFNTQLAEPDTLTKAGTNAKDTAAALLVSPIVTSVVLIVYTEAASWAVEFTAGWAAVYTAHTFSGQRRVVLVCSVITQMCILVILPCVILGDPYSWHSFGKNSANSVFGKCRYLLESQVKQRLPGSEFMPGGFVEFTMWLQIINAVMTPILRLLAPINPLHLIKMVHGKGFQWNYHTSGPRSDAYVVRSTFLAICYAGVQPLGLGVGGLSLCITYTVDRFCAKRASPDAQAVLRRGAGVGDLVDGQTVCMLLSLAVILHALLDIVFLESLRLTPNPFLTPSSNFSAVDYLVLVYPLLELVAALCTLGYQAEGPILWLAFACAMFVASYQVWPVDGGGMLDVARGGPYGATASSPKPSLCPHSLVY